MVLQSRGVKFNPAPDEESEYDDEDKGMHFGEQRAVLDMDILNNDSNNGSQSNGGYDDDGDP
jgi:hypothetical protein